MESIESLQFALRNTRARWCSCRMTASSGPAWPRAIEILPSGEIVDYRGGYEDYLTSRGIEA